MNQQQQLEAGARAFLVKPHLEGLLQDRQREVIQLAIHHYLNNSLSHDSAIGFIAVLVEHQALLTHVNHLIRLGDDARQKILNEATKKPA